MTTKEAQINLRLPADLDEWVEVTAGGKRAKPAFVREVLERERAREAEREMTRVFNVAWDALSPEEQARVRQEREEWVDAYDGYDKS